MIILFLRTNYSSSSSISNDIYSNHNQSTLKLKSKNISNIVTLILEEEQEEQEIGEYYDAQSPLYWKYDEFAAAVVAAENKKRSERKLRRLFN